MGLTTATGRISIDAIRCIVIFVAGLVEPRIASVVSLPGSIAVTAAQIMLALSLYQTQQVACQYTQVEIPNGALTHQPSLRQSSSRVQLPHSLTEASSSHVQL